MKLNKNSNRIKLSKTKETHIYVYIFMHGSVQGSIPMEILAYTSHMQQEIASFKGNASIFI